MNRKFKFLAAWLDGDVKLDQSGRKPFRLHTFNLKLKEFQKVLILLIGKKRV